MTNLNPTTISIVLSTLIIIVASVTLYLQTKSASTKEKIDALKNEISFLFLYAEKEGWIGEDKIKFVTDFVYNNFPVEVKLILKQQTVEVFVQGLYDEFKKFITENKVTEFKVVPSPAPAADTDNIVDPDANKQA